VLSSGVCVKVVPWCSSYNSLGCVLCNSGYYLQSNSCRPYPEGCLSYELATSRCLSCASNYILVASTGICNRKVNDNCLTYNQQQCVYCISRYYLKAGACWPYPSYCATVDLLGNCLSCSFGSILAAGVCQPADGRQRNCLSFDNAKMICLACLDGYSLCPATGLCLRPDPGCDGPTSSNGDCLTCKDPYVLSSGRCLLYPPGVVRLPNGGISCLSGYYLYNNSCLRTESTLTAASSLTTCQFGYSSGNGGLSSFIGSNGYWTPSSLQINEYLSMTFTHNQPQIIFQVGVRGTRQGWVSGYVLYYRNRADAPFVCWNGCNMVVGNSDGDTTSWLKLYHPIIATEVRVYPVRWVGVLALQTDLSILSYD
jgi:hypothetical protein